MIERDDVNAFSEVPEDLVSALEVIEDQPLGQRAGGYAALHAELARRLESDAAGSGPLGGSA